MEDTFTCDACGGTFEKEWGEEEAEREAEELWNIKNASQNKDIAMVCDNCFEIIRNSIN